MKTIAAVLMALLCAACATMRPSGPDAAYDIQQFLIAIRDGDRAGFERHVDREALKIQLRSRVLAEAARQGSGGNTANALGALLGSSLVGLASDTFIQPEVFRAVAEYKGYRPDMGMPTPNLIARALRTIDERTVCVAPKADDPCLLVFRNLGGTYRLVGYEGELSALMPRRRAASQP